MKKDTSVNIIDLDSILNPEPVAQPTEIITESVNDTVTDQPVVNVDWEEIVTEWFYRLPKGYAEQPYNESELRVLNEILFEHGIYTTSVNTTNEATDNTEEPYIKNTTTLKEAMVCLFYDATANGSFDKLLVDTQQLAIQSTKAKGTKLTTEQIDSVILPLQDIFQNNKTFYGSANSTSDDEPGGSMPTDNLVDWIRWAYTVGDSKAVTSINNSMAAARSIRATLGQGVIIRNELFDDIRNKAVELAADLGVQRLKPDNWCPGDVYLVSNVNVAAAASENAISLTTSLPGQPSLNSYFTDTLKSNSIVACSLKEQKHQAGKATEFLPKVFSAAYDAKINPDDVETDVSAKDIGKISAGVKRFKEYSPSYPKIQSPKRAKSYYDAIVKGGSIESSVNLVLKSANQPVLKTKDIVDINDKKNFDRKNAETIAKIERAIKKVEKLVSPASVVESLRPVFIKSRNAFIKYISGLNVKVETVNSDQAFKAILATPDPVNVIAKKIQAYDLAIKIMDNWVNRGMGNRAYAKILRLSNPFAALTSFAIAETGINPGFWKFVGSERSPIGHAHWLDPMADVDIVDDTTPIELNDSKTFAGFELDYNVKVGADTYNTTLSFRFSDSQIRIEVSNLSKV